MSCCEYVVLLFSDKPMFVSVWALEIRGLWEACRLNPASGMCSSIISPDIAGYRV